MPVVAMVAAFEVSRPKPNAPLTAARPPLAGLPTSAVTGKRRWNTRTQPLWPAASMRAQPLPRSDTFTGVSAGTVDRVRASAVPRSFSSVARLVKASCAMAAAGSRRASAKSRRVNMAEWYAASADHHGGEA